MSTAARRGPRGAEDRLRRLLVMLPWLMERGEVPVADAARHFGLTEDEVVHELELAAMCGLPPFVDEMIDVFIDDGMIQVGVPRLFTRPLRLNAVEAWELLAAGRAAMQLPGAVPEGPLGRGLAKLATSLGDDDTAGVSVDLARPELAGPLVAAVESAERLRIAYWSASRDELTTRLVVPRQLFTDRGEWYVSADDDRSGEVRTFRVDRIESVESTGERGVSPLGELPTPGRWFTDAGIARARLRLGPGARWIVERYPVDDVGEADADGWVEAVLPLASERWFVRILLGLGPDVEVIDPPELADAVRESARQVLARYRASAS